MPLLPEQLRLKEAEEHTKHWKRWGPYLAERAWGTVREDYSPNGTAWEYFPHEDARSRVYRWTEDGILGICDNHQYLCFALAFWNGKDPILKERLFGLTGNEGNHGEDVKELYYYLEATPTNSYLKGLYKYPQAAYPYDQLLSETLRRTRLDPEYELEDTGIFAERRYFDIFAEYAKNDVDDISDPRPYRQSRSRYRRSRLSSYPLVPQHLVLDQHPARRETAALKNGRLYLRRRSSFARYVSISPARARRKCSSLKTKPTRSAFSVGVVTTISIRMRSTNT